MLFDMPLSTGKYSDIPLVYISRVIIDKMAYGVAGESSAQVVLYQSSSLLLPCAVLFQPDSAA
jgi:hypothetical protein